VNPFDRLAPFYDREHAELLEDLPFYLGLARRVGGPILEAGCGSGRLLLPLARAGYEVVGLDTSRPMLALAERKLAGEEALAERVRLVRGDLRSARLGQLFKLAIVGLDSFGLITEQPDQRRALATLRRHLLPDGLLALDVANGNLRGGEAAEETILQAIDVERDEERQVAKWVVRRTDHARQLDRLLHLYDESGPDGLVRRTSVEVELRYYTRYELELLLERAHFVLEALFGDYDLSPFEPHSQRLIVLAHVKSGRQSGGGL
jgi:SAM-dependent methyltransferase